MIKEEIRLKLTEATESLSKTYEILQDLSEHLSIENINGKKSSQKIMNPQQMDYIKAWTKITLKKNEELTFKILFSLVHEKVSPRFKLTYKKLKTILDKYPEFTKKTAKGAKKMGRTPFVYSYSKKEENHE